MIVLLDELDGCVEFAKKSKQKTEKSICSMFGFRMVMGRNKTIDEAQDKVVNICYSLNQLITSHAHHPKVKKKNINLAKSYITTPSSTIKTVCVVHQPLNTT